MPVPRAAPARISLGFRIQPPAPAPGWGLGEQNLDKGSCVCGEMEPGGRGEQVAEKRSACPECKARKGLECRWQDLVFFKHRLLWQRGRKNPSETEGCCIYGWKRRSLQVATPGATDA